jgi:HSP20 family molecular chaperone IbpA
MTIQAVETMRECSRRVPVEAPAQNNLNAAEAGAGSGRKGLHGSFTPIDMQELSDGYAIYVYLNGDPHAAVQIIVRGRMLTIRNEDGAHPWLTRMPGEGNLYGCFSFGFLLPDDADTNRIHASRLGNMLKVRISKAKGLLPWSPGADADQERALKTTGAGAKRVRTAL